MSTSIIDFKNSYVDYNDGLLITSLAFLKYFSSKKILPQWYKIYEQEVIIPILNIKPVGYTELSLNEYLVDDEKLTFFIDLLNHTKSEILKRYDKSDKIEIKDCKELIEISFIDDYVIHDYIINFDNIIKTFESLAELLRNGY